MFPGRSPSRPTAPVRSPSTRNPPHRDRPPCASPGQTSNSRRASARTRSFVSTGPGTPHVPLRRIVRQLIQLAQAPLDDPTRTSQDPPPQTRSHRVPAAAPPTPHHAVHPSQTTSDRTPASALPPPVRIASSNAQPSLARLMTSTPPPRQINTRSAIPQPNIFSDSFSCADPKCGR